MYAIKSLVCSMVCCLLLAQVTCGQSKQGQTETNLTPTVSNDFDAAWNLILTVAERVTNEHISPPTRQQMFLGAAKGIYLAADSNLPRELVSSFSSVTTNADFEHLILGCWKDVSSKSNFSADNTTHLSIQSLLNTASSGMSYVSAKEHIVQKQLSENQYVGIGIQVAYENGMPKITDPFIGGAAQKAGAKPGDFIVEINGNSTRDRPFRELIEELRGPKNSKVTVVLRHQNEKHNRTYTMVRNVIPIPTVRGVEQQLDGTWKLQLRKAGEIKLDKRVAYLGFQSIVGSTAAEFSQLAQQIEREKFENVILDFRNIRDPEIHHVVMLADSLLSHVELGKIHAVDGETKLTTGVDSELNNASLIVLADQNVPGTLFMLLSALKKNDRALFVGQPIRSDRFCKKSVELAAIGGAIQGFAYGICVPNFTEQESGHARNLMGEQIRLQGGFLIQPDVPATELSEDLFRNIRKHLKTIQSN